MIRVEAVDLAAKMSAACVLSPDGVVEQEWDSWGASQDDFLTKILAPFENGSDNAPDALVVEDLPHGLKFMGLVRQVCRIQGRIGDRMERFGLQDRILFVPPASWQRSYDGLWRQGPEKVIPKAKEFGYLPPAHLWSADFKGADRQKAKKVQSDYCAAFLIGKWAQRTFQEFGTLDVQATCRYE